MIVHIAEAYLDHEKSCVLGVYDTEEGARKRLYAADQDHEKWGFDHYAINAWMVGESMPSEKRWFYPAYGGLVEMDD